MLNTKRTTPYPTIQALLREIASAFDTKSYLSTREAKKLDDSCNKTIDIHVSELEELKNLTILTPLITIFGAEIAARVELFLDDVIKCYFIWIEAHPLDGVSVEDANILFQTTGYFEDLLISRFVMEDNYNQKLCVPDGVNLTLLSKDHIEAFILLLDDKEAKDRVRLWASEKERPSLKYVENIEQFASPSIIASKQWNNHKWGIIASRFIMSFHSNKKMGLATQRHSHTFKSFHSKNANNYLEIKSHINAIFAEFKEKGGRKKTDSDRERVDFLLKNLKYEIDKIASDYEVSYIYHQFRARHLVLCGDLDTANEEYTKAFEQSLYRAHSKAQIQLVISEALLVAAYQVRPDRVFLTRLKSASILIGLDQLPAKVKVEGKHKLEVLNSNEIESYRVDFARMFPEKLAYPSVSYPKYDPKVGLLLESLDSNLVNELSKKKIKIGSEGSLQRKTTPLIAAAMRNEVALVQKILDSGASVNVISEVGETPLLMALNHLDFQDATSKMDHRLYDLISQYKHSDMVLNQRTTRKAQTPLFAAVDTGNPDIVKKIISMSNGIQIDLQAGLDFATPLYHAISLLSIVKHPSRFKEILSGDLSEENIHRLKPMFAGMAGFEKHIKGQGITEHHQKILEKYTDYCFQIYLERKPSPAKIRQIARVLIVKGADVNFVHRVNGMLYTPLMLAAENDEIQLFKMMIEHGGDWRKTYTVPSSAMSYKKAVNCLDIAKNFKSYRVVEHIENVLCQN
jgi:ankyrin repeat protein